jgi:hypothetical protein
VAPWYRVTILTGIDGGQNVRLLRSDMDALGIEVGRPVAMVVRFGLFEPPREDGTVGAPMLIAVYVRPVTAADLDQIADSAVAEPVGAR